MSRKSLLYYLFSKNKKPLYVDGSGHVQEGDPDTLLKPDGQPAHLQYSPQGWKDTLVKWVRNIKYMGLFRDMTVPMNFVGDGALILRDRYWKNGGVENSTFLGIAKLDRTGLPHTYKSWYLSEINQAKYKENETGVQVEALEGGLSKLLKANENTVYELPIDLDPDHINILMDGQELDFSQTSSIVENQPINGVANYYLGMVGTAVEGRTPDIIFQDILPVISTSFPNDNWYLNFDQINASSSTMTFRVKGSIKVFFNKNVPFELRVDTNDGTSTIGPQYDLVNLAGSPRPAGTTETFSFDVTFTVPAGTRAHMKIFGGSPTDSTTQFTVLDGEIVTSYVYRFKPTYIKAHFAYKVLELLVDKISNGLYTWKSNWLKSFLELAITSGDALRGIVTDNSDPLNPIKGAVIKTSLSDFFKSMNHFGVGLGIENDTLRLELLPYFFQDTIVAGIGTVSAAEITVAEDLMGNTIKAGGPKVDYTDANGRYETNQGQLWSTPVTKVIKEIDLSTPYRRDAFGAEMIRINYDKKKTTDSSSDNDTFMLNINTTALIDTVPDPDITYYTLKRPSFSAVSGIPHPGSAYNLLFTPHWTLLNNGAFLHSILDQMDILNITMTSSDKNAELSTTLAGVTVKENDPIQIGSLTKRLFLNCYVTVKTETTVNIADIIASNPYGKVAFHWNNQVWYGFLMDPGVKPATLDAQTWKFLMAPENDMSKFNAR